MAKPVLVIVDDEEASRQEPARELELRYGTHYRIVALPSLPDAIHRDQWGFILTGPDATPHWPLRRAPFLFETTTPGVFAVGDVRHGSVKRVASAVGKGSVTIRLVHDYLAVPWCVPWHESRLSRSPPPPASSVKRSA